MNAPASINGAFVLTENVQIDPPDVPLQGCCVPVFGGGFTGFCGCGSFSVLVVEKWNTPHSQQMIVPKLL
jgi:hypothetical protein